MNLTLPYLIPGVVCGTETRAAGLLHSLAQVPGRRRCVSAEAVPELQSELTS